jgi:hypothetical protein
MGCKTDIYHTSYARINLDEKKRKERIRYDKANHLLYEYNAAACNSIIIQHR